MSYWICCKHRFVAVRGCTRPNREWMGMQGLALPHDPSYYDAPPGVAYPSADAHGNWAQQPASGTSIVSGGGWYGSAEPAPHGHLPEAPTGAPGSPHMRWGRLAVLVIAIGLLAFAVANMFTGSPSKPTGKQGDTPISVSRSVGTGDDLNGAAPGSTLSRAPVAGGGGTPTVRRNPARRQRAIAARRARAAQARAAARAHRGMAARTRGSGASSLPYTGASSWIAALIGILLLGTGIIVQLKAVAIADTASLYQRGPLLRPAALVSSAIDHMHQALPLLSTRMEEFRDRVSTSRGSDFVRARRR